jgi:DNA-binding NarL/FixJ family response regulator
MIKVCIADNAPVISYGICSYFKNHSKINCIAEANSIEHLLDVLNTKEVDLLLLDMELNGLSSLRDIKSLIQDYPKLKIIIFTLVAEKVYAQATLKMGVAAYLDKTSELTLLEDTIENVMQNATISKKKVTRLFKKVSNREIEVLRYLNNGKKNKEIAQILGIDEKTISTYKLRLLTKLNVTNLVDLLKKAKDLEII